MNKSVIQKLNRDDLKLEERKDGIYMWVKPDMQSSLDLDSFRSALDGSFIMNYDWDRICAAVSKPSGKAEYIGELFEIYDSRKDEYITLNVTSKEAFLSIDEKVQDTNYRITVKDIAYKIKQKKVLHGIDWDTVSRIVNKKAFDKAFRIAACTPAEDGKDAEIKNLVKVEADARPMKLDDGKVDFKSIESFPQAKQGEKLAEKLPATKGKAGMDIFGKKIVPRSGSDKEFPSAENVSVSENGLFMIADVDGCLYKKGSVINVAEILAVKNNVDFSTGHIKYKGDVVIYRDVLNGFKIDAHGDIRIEGDVEGAEITSRNGSIDISGGVFGKKKAKLTAGVDISVNMAQDAVVKCQNEFRAKKYVYSCRVNASSIVLPEQCGLSGNSFTAYEKIEINQVQKGNEESSFNILDKQSEEKKEKLDKLKSLHLKTVDSTKPLEKRIRAMAAMLKKMDELPTPKVREEIKKVQEQFRLLQQKAEFIKDQIRKLEAVPEINLRDGVIIIWGNTNAHLKINMYDTLMEIDKPVHDKTLIWVDGVIELTTAREPGEEE